MISSSVNQQMNWTLLQKLQRRASLSPPLLCWHWAEHNKKRTRVASGPYDADCVIATSSSPVRNCDCKSSLICCQLLFRSPSSVCPNIKKGRGDGISTILREMTTQLRNFLQVLGKKYFLSVWSSGCCPAWRHPTCNDIRCNNLIQFARFFFLAMPFLGGWEY